METRTVRAGDGQANYHEDAPLTNTPLSNALPSSEERISGALKRWSAVGAVCLTLAHASAFCAYRLLFESFEVSPEEAGIDFATVLSREALWISIVALTAILLVGTYSLIVGLVSWPLRMRPIYANLISISIAAVIYILAAHQFVSVAAFSVISVVVISVLGLTFLSLARPWWKKRPWLRACLVSVALVLCAIAYMTSVIDPLFNRIVAPRVVAIKEGHGLHGGILRFAEPLVQTAFIDRSALPKELNIGPSDRLLHLGTGKSAVFFDVDTQNVVRLPSSVAFVTIPWASEWLVESVRDDGRLSLVDAVHSYRDPVTFTLLGISLPACTVAGTTANLRGVLPRGTSVRVLTLADLLPRGLQKPSQWNHVAIIYRSSSLVSLNAELVSEGLSRVDTESPPLGAIAGVTSQELDLRVRSAMAIQVRNFSAIEDDARNAGRGIWSRPDCQ